jgi:hypothetical protein
MASGGHDTRWELDRQVVPRSRTGLIMDQLLSRGPLADAERLTLVTDATNGPSSPGSWASVAQILGAASASILEGHLTWLVALAPREDHLSAHRVLMEDQARILIRALDERHEDDVITRALEQPWTAEDVIDDDEDLIGYASDLNTTTSGQPHWSPYVALAHSAGKVVAEVLHHRNPSTGRPRSILNRSAFVRRGS